jgi:cytosine/uracil/thiamine/allantoin permease
VAARPAAPSSAATSGHPDQRPVLRCHRRGDGQRAQFKIDGKIIESPADIVHAIPNTAVLVAASLSLLILTIAVNLMANFVAPIYALTNLFPKKLDFARAGLVSAVIGLVILPWNLYDSPVVINYFLGGLGALLGPLFGIIIADYWLVRRGKIDVPALYTEDPTGAYHYRGGVNLHAVAAFIPAARCHCSSRSLPHCTRCPRSPGSSAQALALQSSS